MRKYRANLPLLSAFCVAAGGDVRVDDPGAVACSERSAWETDSGVGVSGVQSSATTLEPAPASPVSAGTFRLLTYNVAGLPDLVSPSHPAVNCVQMSPFLNEYDLAFIQEDFWYHADLGSHARHAFRSEPMRDSLALTHDGLSMFSAFGIGVTRRMRWLQCNGYVGGASDCLADKGFSFTEVTLASGVTIDAYNLHADSGLRPVDVEARRKNFAQLESFLRTRPATRAVVIAGDTNLSVTSAEDMEILDHFLRSNGLTDACDAVHCGEAEIDRVLVRSSVETELSPRRWWKDARFVNATGDDLSDHPAVGVELSWRTPRAQALAAYLTAP